MRVNPIAAVELTSSIIGLYTTPTVGTLPIVSPIDTHTNGNLK